MCNIEISKSGSISPGDSVSGNANTPDNQEILLFDSQTSEQGKPKQTKLIVQNNESIEQIARLVLKSRGKDFDYNDIRAEIDNIKLANLDCLDGTKKGFIVGSEIIVNAEIDVSGRKTADASKYNYVHATGSKRVRDIADKYTLKEKDRKNFSIKTCQAYHKAKLVYDEYVKEFGKLESASMEHLILSPHYEISPELGERIKKVRGHYFSTLESDSPEKFERISTGAKKYKAGNCAEIATLANKIAYENNIEASKIFTFDGDSGGHTALIIGGDDKLIPGGYFSNDEADDTDKLNETISGTFVVDPWLNGIYKTDDWIKMVRELYPDANRTDISYDREL
jgi:hypothetical protein